MPRGRNHRPDARRAGAWLGLAVVLSAAEARAAPALECRAERLQDRAFVQLTLRDGLGADLERLVRRGLEARVRLELALYRRRRFWFDERLAVRIVTPVLRWQRARGSFTLDDRPIADVARFALPRQSVRPDAGPLAGGAHYIQATVEVEVVTAKSLGQMVRWLSQDGEGEPEGGLTGSLLRSIASELTRQAETVCGV